MEVRLHRSDEDLEQILHLQKQNHKDLIDQSEAQKEGYVTVRHDIDALKEICQPDGHVIALHEGRVIGYALTMHSQYAEAIPVLSELMDQMKAIEGSRPFLIMGQLCVAKDWRGKGVVRELYNHMKTALGEKYDGIYTEVAADNPRSMKAHLKNGYQLVKTYSNSAGKPWHLIYCNWNK